MHFLSIESLTKSYGIQPLFENITFHINEGDRVALIARNGAGKSTLLKILVGKEFSESGKVVVNRDIRLIYLEQENAWDENQKTIDNVFNHNDDKVKALKQYNELLSAETQDEHAIHLAAEKIEFLQAWDTENQIETILSKLNINFLHQKIGTLSGGQKKRLALAKALIEMELNPGHCLLLLDEPTNHLDMGMIEWLENYLNNESRTLLLVTHDRFFMDNVCNRIVELDDNTIYEYDGDFAYYLEKKEARITAAASEQDKLKNLYRRELEWVRKQPKARTTKSKARTEAFDDLEQKALKRKSDLQLELNMKMTRLGGKVLEMKKVYKNYGDRKILAGFDYTFKRKERIGIIGVNGTGKTTFLNLISGKEEADSGKINLGETVVLGYFDQKGLVLKEDMRVIEYVKNIAEHFVLADGTKVSAGQFLELFLFEPEKQYTYVSKLSGGERRRLQMLALLYQNPNFLILDEPTNDLDLVTLQVLENFLTYFEGCILMVSHDRYFMDKLVDHLFIFEGDGVVNDFPGNYSEYRVFKRDTDKKRKEENVRIKEELAAMPVIEKPKEKKKLSYKDQREYEMIEQEMQELQAKQTELSAILNNETNYDKIQAVGAELEKISTNLTKKEERWLELAMMME
jgi:ATP-binding cassette subfamily F protein uup